MWSATAYQPLVTVMNYLTFRSHNYVIRASLTLRIARRLKSIESYLAVTFKAAVSVRLSRILIKSAVGVSE